MPFPSNSSQLQAGFKAPDQGINHSTTICQSEFIPISDTVHCILTMTSTSLLLRPHSNHTPAICATWRKGSQPKMSSMHWCYPTCWITLALCVLCSYSYIMGLSSKPVSVWCTLEILTAYWWGTCRAVWPYLMEERVLAIIGINSTQFMVSCMVKAHSILICKSSFSQPIYSKSYLTSSNLQVQEV